MKSAVLLLTCCTITLTACTSNLPITYAPIIDEKKVNLNKYSEDLKECREFAQQVENDTAMAGILMAVAGAGIGAAVGNQYDMTGRGAAYGATLGATTGTLHGETAYNTQVKDVIDSCLNGRGYKVLGRK